MTSFKWWQYKAAGTFNGLIELPNTNTSKISFTAPKVKGPKTIHIILEVADDSSPTLKSFKRIIITVVP